MAQTSIPRQIGGVILGYLAMAIVVSVALTLLFVALGAGRVFQPGTTEVTALWLAGTIVLSGLAAMLGGWLATAVGQSRRTALWLAGLVLVLGIAMAALQPPPPPTTLTPEEIPQLGPMEAGKHGRQPAWYPWLLPLLGAAGVWAGSRLKVVAEP